MSNLGPLLERNRAFAATGAHAGLAIMPRLQVFLVTCLDPRVDPAAFLGVELGDAPVIRNAGGRVTEAVINDIAFISDLARTMIPDGPLFEVAVVHHTGCGTGFLADAGFRSAFAVRTGLDEAVLAAEAVIDPAATVRADVERLLSSPKMLPQISVSGHVYDLQTGLVTTIADPAQPQQAPRPSAAAPPHRLLSVQVTDTDEVLGTHRVAQAAKNLVTDLEDTGCRARFLIRDRDGKSPAGR